MNRRSQKGFETGSALGVILLLLLAVGLVVASAGVKADFPGNASGGFHAAERANARRLSTRISLQRR